MVFHFAPLWWETRHKEMWIQFKHFLASNWESLQEEFFFQAQTLSASSSSILFPQHDPLTHKCLLYSLAFGCVREYFQTVPFLAPFFLALTSFDTTSIVIVVHLKLDGYFSLFVEDYKSNHVFELSFDSFKLAFQHMLHLSTSGPSRMVFEHLRDCFHPKNSMRISPLLFQLCFHISQGHIPPQMAHVLATTHFLTMTKPSCGVRPIVVGETLYRMTNYNLCLQFCETFATHFPPYPFRVTTKGGCDLIIHNIKCTLDLHPNWVVLPLDVVNTFNSMLKGVVF